MTKNITLSHTRCKKTEVCDLCKKCKFETICFVNIGCAYFKKNLLNVLIHFET